MTVTRYSNSQQPSVVGTVAAGLMFTGIAVTLDSHLRQGDITCLTAAKVQRTILYGLGSLFPLVTSRSTNNDGGSVLLSLLGSAACVFGASQIRDYNDPKELATMTMNAQHMSFSELVKTHGLDLLIRHRIVTDLSAKFELAYAAQPFSKTTRDYSLETIAQNHLCSTPFLHDKFVQELTLKKWNFLSDVNLGNTLYINIMSPEMYSSLVDIKKQLEEIDHIQRCTLANLDTRYPERTEIQQRKFAEREKNISVEAREFGKTVAAQALASAVNTAMGNAVSDGNTKHVVRDASTGLNVAEAARKAAEQATTQRLRADLKRDREDLSNIARGAQQQRLYNDGVADARQIREASIASLENQLTQALAL